MSLRQHNHLLHATAKNAASVNEPYAVNLLR